MKYLILFAALSLSSCTRDELNISGKPVSEWVRRLADLDPNVSFEAYAKLDMLSEDQIKPYRTELREAANKGSDFAAELLFINFKEVDIRWLDTYLRRLSDSYWISAIDKLESDQDNHTAVVAGLQKVAKDGGESLHLYSLSAETVGNNKEAARLYLEGLGYRGVP